MADEPKVEELTLQVINTKLDAIRAESELRDERTKRAFEDLAGRVTKVEEDMAWAKEKLSTLDNADDREARALAEAKAARVDRAICDVLGLDYEALAETGQVDKPVAKPKTTLTHLARGHKGGLVLTTLTLLTVLAELLLELLRQAERFPNIH